MMPSARVLLKDVRANQEYRILEGYVIAPQQLAAIVVFRSAKESPFAERKATLNFGAIPNVGLNPLRNRDIFKKLLAELPKK